MDTDITTNSAPASESTPTTPEHNSSPATTFGDDVPNWVKTAGLTAAHHAAKPGGEPAAAATPPAQSAAVPPVTPTAPGVAAPAATPPPPTPPAAFDQAALARAVAEGVRTATTPAPQGPTDAQLAQQLGIYTATPEVYKSILGVEATSPDQVTALNTALQSVARQAVNIAQVLQQQAMRDFEARINPYIATVRQNEATRVKEGFFKSHTDLAGYEPLVKQTYEAVLASGQKFASLDEASKFVADRTREMLKNIGITPAAPAALPSAQTKPRTTTPPARTMSPTSLGGRSGGSPAAPATKMTAVWGSQ